MDKKRIKWEAKEKMEICVECGKAYPERPSQISKGSRKICFDCELGERKVQDMRKILDEVKDPENWKKPTQRVQVNTEAEASKIMEALVYFLGGAEENIVFDSDGLVKYTVGSRGYYHYIGA